MGYAIGTVTSGPNSGDANAGVVDAIVTLATANGWTTQRYVNTGIEREWIGKALGLSGTEEIYVGFKVYQDVGGDYYNLKAATMTGYVSGNSFEAQPGIKISGCPSHNNSVTYFITANAQRIVGCLKVGTPVYTHFYLGKFFPYARPGEFPSPLIAASMFNDAEAKRFSDVNYDWPYFGKVNADSYCFMRDQAGSWATRYHYPFSNGASTSNALAGPQGSNTLVPAGDYYQPEPIILQDSVNSFTPENIYGELDGVYFVSGFNNGVENVLQMGGSSTVDQTGLTVLQAVDAILAVGGRAFVITQNVNRTSWRDYVGIEMS